MLFFRDTDMNHVGSHLLIYCAIPASPCATAIASRLVLWLPAARSGFVTTSSHNPDHKITKPELLYVQFITSYYVSIIIFTIMRLEKMQVQKTLFLAYLSCDNESVGLFVKYITTFEMNFR